MEVKNRNDIDLNPNLDRHISHKKESYRNPALLIIVLLFGFLSTIYIFNMDKNNFPKADPPAKKISIAVLPFKNMNPDMANQYFADGVMETVLNRLSKNKVLNVTSRTSVEQFRNTIKTVPEIGQQLKVAYIIEGSVQKYGEEVKITARLVNVQNDAQIWSQNYTRIFKDVLLLQGEIADGVAYELLTSLSDGGKETYRVLDTQGATLFP